MSNRKNLPADAKKIVLVPLGKLKKSPKNVRKMPHTKADIQSLAASIAAVGMLQYPVVEPEIGPRGKETGCYLVNAGEGRRLAQLLRVKRKEIKADEPIPCLLDTEHSATEISQTGQYTSMPNRSPWFAPTVATRIFCSARRKYRWNR